MLHYTDQAGWNAIRSQLDWLFHAHQPPAGHPFGAYFTILPPDTINLAKKLRIPKRKREFVFCFTGYDGLIQIAGGRGDFIWYAPNDYRVARESQTDNGRTDEGKCS